MIIRHGEKPEPGRSHGVEPDGGRDHNSLTVTGWVRAGALVDLFAPTSGDPRSGLRRPDAVYASAAEGDRSKRAIETVTPLAARLGLDVVRRFAHGDEAHLIGEIAERTGATLIAWHHHAIHKLVKHLQPASPTPPRHWPNDRFDMVWTFRRSGTEWVFDQVPQMLLPGDLPDPITT